MENEKNTIAYLNTKIWYRLIKVFYVLIFLTTILIGVLLISATKVAELDLNKTKVLCYSWSDPLFLFPEKHFSFSLKDVGISYLTDSLFVWNSFNYKDFLTEDSEKALNITLHCENQRKEETKNYEWKYVFILQKTHEVKYWNKSLSQTAWGYEENTLTEDELQQLANAGANTEDVIKVNRIKTYETYINQSSDNYKMAEQLDFSTKMFYIIPAYSYAAYILRLIGLFLWTYIVFEIFRRLFYYIILWAFFPKKN